MRPRIWHVGRDLQSRLKGFFEVPPGPDAAPLELLQAALDDLERRVQPAGRGRRLFPYDRIVVRVAQPHADREAVEAVFGQLEPRLRDRLAELRCEAPGSIEVRVALVDPQAAGGGPVMEVECSSDRPQRPAPAVATAAPRVTITILKGQCAEPEYALEETQIAIGRTAEPTDAQGLVRYNHIAFLDVRDGVTETVGRAHARLQFHAESGHFHLYNEGSSNPTSIVRGGRMIRVAPRDPRGVRVQSGDQLQLGRAVVRLAIGEPR